jgi:hypothetical protein
LWNIDHKEAAADIDGGVVASNMPTRARSMNSSLLNSGKIEIGLIIVEEVDEFMGAIGAQGFESILVSAWTKEWNDVSSCFVVISRSSWALLFSLASIVNRRMYSSYTSTKTSPKQKSTYEGSPRRQRISFVNLNIATKYMCTISTSTSR